VQSRFSHQCNISIAAVEAAAAAAETAAAAAAAMASEPTADDGDKRLDEEEGDGKQTGSVVIMT